ncbi:MAG TPA: hypothetical protein VFC21_07975 [Bryobacteraceae bacterium]|nr:hypothetical protein [Bryobacteraceae bacterium]
METITAIQPTYDKESGFARALSAIMNSRGKARFIVAALLLVASFLLPSFFQALTAASGAAAMVNRTKWRSSANHRFGDFDIALPVSLMARRQIIRSS